MDNDIMKMIYIIYILFHKILTQLTTMNACAMQTNVNACRLYFTVLLNRLVNMQSCRFFIYFYCAKLMIFPHLLVESLTVS